MQERRGRLMKGGKQSPQKWLCVWAILFNLNQDVFILGIESNKELRTLFYFFLLQTFKSKSALNHAHVTLSSPNPTLQGTENWDFKLTGQNVGDCYPIWGDQARRCLRICNSSLPCWMSCTTSLSQEPHSYVSFTCCFLFEAAVS